MTVVTGIQLEEMTLRPSLQRKAKELSILESSLSQPEDVESSGTGVTDVFVSCRVGAGNRTQAIWKSNQLSHFSNPDFIF